MSRTLSTSRTRDLIMTLVVLCASRIPVASAQGLLDATTIQQWADAAFSLGIFLVVSAAAIFIGIGAYFYFAAGGNAEMAGRGKEYIQRSILGLILGLLAFVILKTISPQFVGPF